MNFVTGFKDGDFQNSRAEGQKLKKPNLHLI